MSQSTQIRAMDDYFHSLLLEEEEAAALELEPTPEPRRLVAVETRVTPRPYFEEPERRERLAELLSQVGQVQEEMEAITHQEVQSLAIEAEEVAVAPVVAPPVSDVVETTSVAEETAFESESEAAQWQNIEPGSEFQALFFDVSGVTFAVPLSELGGIHRISEVTSIFGQAPWFSGLMTMREEKLKVVDTALWVMPDNPHTDMPPYHYLITLGDSSWGLSCHYLKGTERLHYDQVKWRHQEGKRPWLAGMVKEKKCALLHVDELLRLLERGVNIEGR